MPDPHNPPVGDGPDPIDQDDPESLRTEILRARDDLLGERAHREVLDDRIAELEAQVEQLAADNEALHAELGRDPLTRALRAIGRRRRRPV